MSVAVPLQAVAALIWVGSPGLQESVHGASPVGSAGCCFCSNHHWEGVARARARARARACVWGEGAASRHRTQGCKAGRQDPATETCEVSGNCQLKPANTCLTMMHHYNHQNEQIWKKLKYGNFFVG